MKTMELETINFKSNISYNSVKGNYSWIKHLLDVGINNLLSKYDEIFPFRMVMIKSGICYICKKKVETFTIRSDDFNGTYNQEGWIYCKKCAPIMRLSKIYYENKQPFLTYSKTDFIRNVHFNFWRVSSNPKIQPYIQKEAKSLRCIGNTLTIFQKNAVSRLYVPVLWKYKGEEYNKPVSLSNLIQFNRGVFGYTKEIFTNIDEKWVSLIKKEYDIANVWCHMLFVFNKINIPYGIIRNICLLLDSLV